MRTFYIASCVFTSRFPELSLAIQEYIQTRFGFPVVRCCVPKYKLQEFEQKMPEGTYRDSWRVLPDSGNFTEGDKVYSLCHNCNNIIEEMHPGVQVYSLWELIDSDASFPLPDFDEKRFLYRTAGDPETGSRSRTPSGVFSGKCILKSWNCLLTGNGPIFAEPPCSVLSRPEIPGLPRSIMYKEPPENSCLIPRKNRKKS